MKPAWLLVGFFIGMLIGKLFTLKRRKRPYLALAEYWVFLPGTEMPDQDSLITRMMSNNPFSRAGRSPLSTSEGILFADVRLHMALSLRSKNPHVFRPDLTDDYVESTPAFVTALDEAKSFVKLRYVSEEPLKDKRHVQFLVHAACAMAELGGAKIIYDVTQAKMISLEELTDRLTEDPDGTRPELNLRATWDKTEENGGCALSHGLTKIGIPELRSAPVDLDERWLATTIMEDAARQIWQLGTTPESVDVSAYDDNFKVLVEETLKGPSRVRIIREQAI